MSVALTTVGPVGQAGPMGDVPDPQVPAKARRRTYSAKYKRDILAEYEACDRDGKGALLRREGLYTSLISAWRNQRDKAVLEALGRPAGAAPPQARGSPDPAPALARPPPACPEAGSRTPRRPAGRRCP